MDTKIPSSDHGIFTIYRDLICTSIPYRNEQSTLQDDRRVYLKGRTIREKHECKFTASF